MSAERDRLQGDPRAWKRWGPYLSERAWGTVREDYSPGGAAWDYFPHDHARSRAYRWSEDGIAGICDVWQHLCFSVSLWNGRDAILKERLFGLGGPEGNHGEDVKEYYFYLDSTPTHSYMKMLYKYPQREFPYADLVETNRRRGKLEPEYELLDTGVFDENRYFDVFVEYAKAEPRDILIRVTAANRGPDTAELHIVPTLWFRNTWSWSVPPGEQRPIVTRLGPRDLRTATMLADRPGTPRYLLHCEGAPVLLFTENETNFERLYGVSGLSPYVKDGIGEAVVNGRASAVNPEQKGSKAAAHYAASVAAGQSLTIRLRLTALPQGTVPDPDGASAFGDFDDIFALRIAEADEFYAELQARSLSEDERLVQRQAFAGLLWSKQYYHIDVERWLEGDPAQPRPEPGRRLGRNGAWGHLNTTDVMSIPDKWEYPWFAAWDLGFHCLPLALLDPEFAKEQLVLLGREWLQHPNGQIPAYEWAFGDVNPPVQPWAAWRVYCLEKEMTGQGDRAFLERVFHKLLLNFTWWVNRKDSEGMNIFEGGFLGLDNIGVFDRSAPLPTGGHIEQSDSTSWMGMFCLYMLTIALELAAEDPVYEDIATKFFEHFLYIARAMNNLGGEGIELWDPADEFFYDVLRLPGAEGDHNLPLKVRSMVGLIPLYAVLVMRPEQLGALPAFAERLDWFLANRPQLASLVSRWQEPGNKELRLLALLRGHRMKRVLSRMLDEAEFLSPYGVRALSRYHEAHPYVLEWQGQRYVVEYDPAESRTGVFGGNSNWRGPIWFPVNYLIIESLQQLYRYYGDDFLVEHPTGSGKYSTLEAIARDLSCRLTAIFLRDESGRRPVFGDRDLFQSDLHWRDYIPFHEYFHGDKGWGLGASHQTGWTGLVALLLQQQGQERERL